MNDGGRRGDLRDQFGSADRCDRSICTGNQAISETLVRRTSHAAGNFMVSWAKSAEFRRDESLRHIHTATIMAIVQSYHEGPIEGE